MADNTIPKFINIKKEDNKTTKEINHEIIEYNNNAYLDERIINSSYIKAFEPQSPIIQKHEIPESTS